MALFQKEQKPIKLAPDKLEAPVSISVEEEVPTPEKEVDLNVLQIPIDYFEQLAPLVQDKNITDVEFSSGDVWTIDTKNNVEKRTDIEFSEGQARALIERINITKSSDFNNISSVLETEAITTTGESLRIEALHHEYAQDGTELYIRKTPAFARLSTKEILKNEFASPEALSFLINSIKSNLCVLIAGEPGAGKTEFGKYLSQFIDKKEHVFVIEDTNEWHIKKLRPGLRNTSVMATTDGANGSRTYKEAIAHSLRCNTNWLMISELRGEEVVDYFKAISTGLASITTLHAGEVKQIPKRIMNMTSNAAERFRIENEVYQNTILGIVIQRDYNSGSRSISQIGLYHTEYENNRCQRMFEGKKMVTSILPDDYLKKFKDKGIENPYYCKEVANACKELGIPFDNKEYQLHVDKKEIPDISKEIRI